MANRPHIKHRNLEQLLNANAAIATADFDTLSGTTASSAELNPGQWQVKGYFGTWAREG